MWAGGWAGQRCRQQRQDQRTVFPKKVGNRRDIRWISVEVSRNEDGTFWTHLHFSNDGRHDGVRFGRLRGKLGTICEPVNDIA